MWGKVYVHSQKSRKNILHNFVGQPELASHQRAGALSTPKCCHPLSATFQVPSLVHGVPRSTSGLQDSTVAGTGRHKYPLPCLGRSPLLILPHACSWPHHTMWPCLSTSHLNLHLGTAKSSLLAPVMDPFRLVCVSPHWPLWHLPYVSTRETTGFSEEVSSSSGKNLT